MGRMALQRNFFSECVAGNKERTVVIISDAMRYEVGAELAALLAEDPKSTVQLTPRLGVLPSYTRLGMAALLPHTRMEMTPEYQVLIDDMPCENLAQRQAVLQKRVPQSGCIQFDDLKAMSPILTRGSQSPLDAVLGIHIHIVLVLTAVVQVVLMCFMMAVI